MKFNEIRNYYFLIRRITTMGGAELLALRRARMFKAMGMQVKIIVIYDDGECFFENEFKEFEILKIDELSKPYCCHTKRSLNKIDVQASEFLIDFDNAIIESQTFHTAVWAEFLVYRHPTMKHIVYAVDDNDINVYKCYPYTKLAIYKKIRGEFWGTEREGLKKIFHSISDSDDEYLPVSFDVSELKETTEPSLPPEMFQKNAFIVSTIGRLEKGYVSEIIGACEKICRNNPSININVIVGGGSIIQGLEEMMKKKYTSLSRLLPNFRVVFMGYIYYIGKDFYKNTDIYVGMGTSSINSISQGCATVNYDPIEKKASGIFGVNVFNFAYVENNRGYDLSELLLSMLSDKDMISKASLLGKKFYEDNYTISATVRKQTFLLEKSNPSIEPFCYIPSMRERFVDMARYYCWSIKNIKKRLFKQHVGMYMN